MPTNFSSKDNKPKIGSNSTPDIMEHERRAIEKIVHEIIELSKTNPDPLWEKDIDQETGENLNAWILRTKKTFGETIEEWKLLSNGKVQHYQGGKYDRSFIAGSRRGAAAACTRNDFVYLAIKLNITIREEWLPPTI